MKKITCAGCKQEVEKTKFCPGCGHEHEEKAVQKPTTDIKSLPVQMTMEQFAEFGTELVKNIVNQLGMDKIDRKHLAVPGMTDLDVDKMNGKQKMAALVRAAIGRDDVKAKALSEGTDSAGGYLVPTEFKAEVVKGLEKPGMIRSLVRVFPVGSDVGEMPTVAGNVTVQWGTENTAITASDPTFGTLTWNINRLDGLNKSSRELFADSAINLGDLLVLLFTEAFAREERNVFITGNGSGKPTGLQNASGLTAYAQAGASLVGDDIVDMYHSLPSQYRMNAVWFMHDDVKALVSKLKDDQNRYLLTDLSQGEPPRLKGRPVIENEYIPTNLGGGGDESLIFFGDPMWYYLFDREMMGVETTTEGGDAFAAHQAWVKVFERFDGKLSLGESFVKGTGIK